MERLTGYLHSLPIMLLLTTIIALGLLRRGGDSTGGAISGLLVYHNYDADDKINVHIGFQIC